MHELSYFLINLYVFGGKPCFTNIMLHRKTLGGYHKVAFNYVRSFWTLFLYYYWEGYFFSCSSNCSAFTFSNLCEHLFNFFGFNISVVRISGERSVVMMFRDYNSLVCSLSSALKVFFRIHVAPRLIILFRLLMDACFSSASIVRRPDTYLRPF